MTGHVTDNPATWPSEGLVCDPTDWAKQHHLELHELSSMASSVWLLKENFGIGVLYHVSEGWVFIQFPVVGSDGLVDGKYSPILGSPEILKLKLNAVRNALGAARDNDRS